MSEAPMAEAPALDPDDAEALRPEGSEALEPDGLEAMEQHALEALAAGDAGEAALRAAALRARFPDEVGGYRWGMLALRLAERIEAAEQLAHAALDRFAGEPAVWAEHVLLAVHRADWDAVAARSEAMRRRFPGEPDGWRFGAQAARIADHAALAEQIGGAGLEAAPSPELLHEHALTALHRGDAAEAARRWAAMRDAFPEAPEGWRHGALALREAGEDEAAEAVSQDGAERFPEHPSFGREHALAAMRRGEWAEAAEAWGLLRETSPDSPEASRFGILALREAGRLDDADQLAHAARQRFPSDADICAEWVSNALPLPNPEEALTRGEAMRDAFPGHPEGFRLSVVALRQAGRGLDADRLGAEALPRFPDAFALWREHAVTAASRDDAAEAARRWVAVRDRFPDQPDGYAGAATAQRLAAGLEEADRRIRAADDMARAGLRRFPDSLELRHEHAMSPTHARDWAEAARRWQDFRDRFPDHVGGYRFGALACRNAGRNDAAEAVALEGLARFPQDPEVWVEHAFNAVDRADQAEAAARWERMRARFPDHPAPYKHGIAALRQAGRLDEAEMLGSAALARAPDPAAPDLVARFESLGDNCELGLVQRHFGADPSGLLRWAAIGVADLIRGLESGFAGLGDPGTLQLVSDGGALMAEDPRLGLRLHTFAGARDVDPDLLLAASARRVAASRDRLLDVLAGSERILVVKQSGANLSDEQSSEVLRAVRRRGPAPLLCVRAVADGHVDGAVEERPDGLMFAYVARLSAAADAGEILFQSWLEVLAGAAAIIDQR